MILIFGIKLDQELHLDEGAAQQTSGIMSQCCYCEGNCCMRIWTAGTRTLLRPMYHLVWIFSCASYYKEEHVSWILYHMNTCVCIDLLFGMDGAKLLSDRSDPRPTMDRLLLCLAVSGSTVSFRTPLGETTCLISTKRHNVCVCRVSCAWSHVLVERAPHHCAIGFVGHSTSWGRVCGVGELHRG